MVSGTRPASTMRPCIFLRTSVCRESDSIIPAGDNLADVWSPEGVMESGLILEVPANRSGLAATLARTTPVPIRNSRLFLFPTLNFWLPPEVERHSYG